MPDRGYGFQPQRLTVTAAEMPILFGARLESLEEVKAGSPMRQHGEPISKISISLEEATAMSPIPVASSRLWFWLSPYSVGCHPRLPAATAFAAKFGTTFFVPNTNRWKLSHDQANEFQIRFQVRSERVWAYYVG